MGKIKFLILLILWSSISLAQIQIFNVYQSELYDNYTEELLLSDEVSFELSVSSSTIMLSNGVYWTILGDITYTKATEFYAYALDENGIKCRIWFHAHSQTSWSIGVEYEDLSFIYRAVRLR